MKQWGRVAALAALAASTAAGGAARAQEKPAGGDFDPKVKALLAQVHAAYQALDALHVKVTGTFTGSREMNEDIPRSAELRYQKPNRIYLFMATQRANGLARRLIVCDGSALWQWESATNTYTKAKAPATLRGYDGLPTDLPDVELLFSPKETFADFPNKAGLTIAAPEKAAGVDVDVLAIKAAPPDAPFTLDLRILFGQKDHLLRGVTADVRGKDAAGKEASGTLTVAYDLGDPKPTYTAADFTVTPPPGAKLAGASKPAAAHSGARKRAGRK